ncbi:hypothetical protein [Mesorhizobium sp. B2-3-15]|uniref:hypothetical protein n=1 Tax=Mesorhizobium sp. B2-3-15 TaxID=2589949 RepID=UPI001127F6DC|nr:hypothetical protein [Mesorhizobium sp. B2-3-15]TPL72298.1 hypothetical protein FJ954_16520 [Mesorhizobium sp. B2-3-15]
MDTETTAISAFTNDQWLHALTAVNAWRGRCLDLFARSESAVSETLLVLANNTRNGAVAKLPHLVGHRFAELAALIGPTGTFASEGKASAAALLAFHPHEGLRASLAHGVGKVVLDQQGSWLLVLRTLTFRSKQPERTVLVIEQNEADEIVKSLQTAGRRLVAELGNLRRALGST